MLEKRHQWLDVVTVPGTGYQMRLGAGSSPCLPVHMWQQAVNPKQLARWLGKTLMMAERLATADDAAASIDPEAHQGW